LAKVEENKIYPEFYYYYRDCKKRISETDYLQKRGISKEVQDKYNIGYDTDFKEGKMKFPIQAIIIPISKDSYTVRNINSASKFRYTKVGEAAIFNYWELEQNRKDTFYIVEGEIDALSIIEAGRKSIALGSVNEVNLLVNKLKEDKFNNKFILMLDNDEKGKMWQEILYTKLKEIGINVEKSNALGKYKDANEFLIKDREKQQRIARRRHRRELRARHSHDNRLLRYHRLREKSTKNISYTLMDAPTNFSILDNRDNVIKYFNIIKRMLNQKEYTQMNLRKITSIDLPTLCLLGAFMLDRNTRSEYLEVTSPLSNSVAYRFFEEAQFENMILNERRPNFNNGAFLSRSKDEVDDKAIGDILTKTVNYFGEKNRQRLRDIHPIIIEIVTNTADHASLDSSYTLPWIINTYETKDSNGNKVKQYCIIDMGVGIYETLINKVNKQSQGKSLWYTIIKRENSQDSYC